MRSITFQRLAEVNKELWLVLSLFVIAAVLNFLVASHRVVLGLYSLPTLFSAYFYGKRHATLTAFASVFMVGLVAYMNPRMFSSSAPLEHEKWFDLTIWGGMLVITAYAMGALYDSKEKHMRELRATYHGVLMILCQFIAKDKYTLNHSHRVAIYAAKISAYLGFDQQRIEDVRAAALLHDIGKLDISRELLYKASRLSEEELAEVHQHVDRGGDMLHQFGSSSLRRIVPIILAHHDRYDGNGFHPNVSGEEIPLESRVIAVADVYDALTSDRPYRKAMSPFEAKEIIVRGSGTDFDPRVVQAFLLAFRRREMEVPEVMVMEPVEIVTPAMA
jgi:putative nucleotidyltransferase with HDIG domain